MLPIQTALDRVTALLDQPDFHLRAREIDEHLDTIVDHARNDEERRAAAEFKVMVLNHVYSAGRQPPEIIEANRVDALKALQRLQWLIHESSPD
jgi:hypothetical protein